LGEGLAAAGPSSSGEQKGLSVRCTRGARQIRFKY
jgi:hypothetical protein